MGDAIDSQGRVRGFGLGRSEAAPSSSDEPFEPLSDEDYDRIYQRHQEQEQAGAAERQRIGQMKRQAHKPSDPDAPIKNALKQAKQFRRLANNARGRRRR
jgi:hypothetical protein